LIISLENVEVETGVDSHDKEAHPPIPAPLLSSEDIVGSARTRMADLANVSVGRGAKRKRQ
jgi:hypothetical protein